VKFERSVYTNRQGFHAVPRTAECLHNELTLEQLDTVTGGENAAVAGALVGGSMMGVVPSDYWTLPTLPPDWVESICHIIVG
jgi:hypothetical protein